MENVTAATKALFKKKRPDVLAVYYEGIDTAGHMYAVYAPPEHPAATADERRQFGGTLAMFYRYQDRLLGELMKTIGTRATYIVVSDHGFMTGADRPKRISSDRLYAEAVRWHRPDGVVLALGPGIGGGTKIEGATIRDVCPTLLALAGVAPSAEMSGRVLPEIVPPERQPVHRVESYEDPRWLADRQATLAESAFEDEMMSRLTALGYISAEGGAASRSARSYVNLGAYYSGRGEPERAAEMFRKALEIDPGNPQAHSNLGRLLADRAEYSEAIPHLVVAFESDSSHFLVGWSLAMAYGNVGRAPEAVPILEHLVGVYPDVPELRVNLGVVYRLAGRLDEARAVLERAVEERPESVAAWGNLGDTYAAMGRTDEAADAYRRALEIDPDDPHASARLARLRRNER
jgi:tetratricopeptide (TPR) repeat protein